MVQFSWERLIKAVQLKPASRAVVCPEGINMMRTAVPLLLSRILMKKLFVLFLWMGFSGIAMVPASAQDTAVPEFRLFKKGQWVIQMVGGALKGPIFVKTQRPGFHFYQANFRVGLMLSDPVDPGYFFKGNLEGLLEITYSDVNGKIDGYFAGGGILLRYNILSLQSKKLIPYMHAGAGIVHNNVYKDKAQRMIGRPTEFTLRSGLGVRFVILDRWSLDLEGALEHISNAGLADRNRGMNGGGILIGMTRYF
jgi:hypothetical protein